MRRFRVWARGVRDQRRPIVRAELDLPEWVELGLPCEAVGRPEAGELEGRVRLHSEQVRLHAERVLQQERLAQWLWFWWELRLRLVEFLRCRCDRVRADFPNSLGCPVGWLHWCCLATAWAKSLGWD